MKATSLLWLAGVLSAVPLAAAGQTTTTTTTTTTTATPTTTGGTESTSESRLVSSFAGWAGSEANARSLVTGLRQGGDIKLTTQTGTPTTGTGGTATQTASFTAPTRPMGYGNVRIALSLAREQLAQSGITNPTPAQIETALMGGKITTTTGTGAGATTVTTPYRGVLQMRADGMGWGQIAQNMGTKLGHVMSGRTPPSATASTSATGSGITTASGAQTSSAVTRGNSASAHQNQARGAGIVTAGGGAPAGLVGGNRGGGAGAGIVTGAGAGAGGGQGSVAARGQAKGHVSP